MAAIDRVTIGVVCTRGVGPERGGRPTNEDNYLVCRNNEARYRQGDNEVVEHIRTIGILLAVADGMGGHEDGDLASTAAVRALSRIFRRGYPREPELHLHRFVLDAHRRLYRKVAELGPVRMGTTLTTCWILDGKVYWCHIGDSRLYLWRDGQITQITRDHTRAEFAERDGRAVEGDGSFLAQNFVYGSRGLGYDSSIRIDSGTDTGCLELRPRDRLVLCSDGLSGPVEDHRIADAIRETPEPQAASTSLMERALASGSDDNVTVVVARIDMPARVHAHTHFEKTGEYDILGNLAGPGPVSAEGLIPADSDPGY
ncbi:MAG: serine/threonine-protein phosphatase [Alphaproteobacteria bacterium]|nr:serine/threonine-protein phosphatase [Alphaproteobacteria bacterium]